MAAIHSKDTKPEMIVRKGLWCRGFRYRLNSPRLPGHPDLVLKKYRTCIFVNGCFWHGHNVELATRFLDCARNDKGGEVKSSECCKIPNTRRELEQTLKSLAFTLNKIWLEEHAVIGIPYPKLDEEDGMQKAAEEQI